MFSAKPMCPTIIFQIVPL